MGLMQEGLRRYGEMGNAPAPANISPSEIKTNRLSLPEAGLGVEIREISRMLFSEGKKIKETEAESQTETPKQDGFEPFVDPETQEGRLFVNGYNGNFAQRMELNRKGVERVLEIAHLDGTVILTSLIAPRKSSEAQGNELAAKRNLFFGDKIQDENRENPSHRVISIPEGWRIEINDTRILEELKNRNLTGEKLQTEFIKHFNARLNQGMWECIWKEKFSSVKDIGFTRKLYSSTILLALPPVSIVTLGGINFLPLVIFIPVSLGFIGTVNGFVNSGNRFRKLDAPWEYFMPMVEIDKVARSAVFLTFKGRTLVKEVKQATK